MTTHEELGLELKVARVGRRLHLYQVARQLGITPARLSQIEGGHRRLSPDLEDKLREILGLPRKQESHEQVRS